MSSPSAFVMARHHGYVHDGPEVNLYFTGPKGGNKGTRCLSPKEARRVAAELLEAAEKLDPERKWAECSNCAWSDKVHELNPIAHIEERVSPGEIMPAGECPQCGALAHLKD